MEQHPIKINKVQIRNLQIEDYVQLSQSFTRVYSDALKYSSTRATEVCVSHVVCMNIVRSFAKH